MTDARQASVEYNLYKTWQLATTLPNPQWNDRDKEVWEVLNKYIDDLCAELGFSSKNADDKLFPLLRELENRYSKN